MKDKQEFKLDYNKLKMERLEFDDYKDSAPLIFISFKGGYAEFPNKNGKFENIRGEKVDHVTSIFNAKVKDGMEVKWGKGQPAALLELENDDFGYFKLACNNSLIFALEELRIDDIIDIYFDVSDTGWTRTTVGKRVPSSAKLQKVRTFGTMSTDKVLIIRSNLKKLKKENIDMRNFLY